MFLQGKLLLGLDGMDYYISETEMDSLKPEKMYFVITKDHLNMIV